MSSDLATSSGSDSDLTSDGLALIFYFHFPSRLVVVVGGDVILQKRHKFLAHLSKVAFKYEKKKESCKNPVAYFFKLPRAGCYRRSAGKIENFKNAQNIVK